MKPSAYQYHASDWGKILALKGHTSSRVLDYWMDGLYKDRSLWDRHISRELTETLKAEYDFDLPPIAHCMEAEDGTVKFQIRFSDGLEVETVLIPFHKRFTICLSTQVGCAMNCNFCYTGTQGLKRNLNAHEIVGQYLVTREWLLSKGWATNPRIVFMGQGEPLHNVDEVLQAIKIFTDKKILAMGPREMTLSTVGYLPGLQRIQEFPRINIALSLHSPFHEQRTELIPVSTKCELKDVMNALDRLPMIEKRLVTYEYLLVKDFNMSDEHVQGLSDLLSHRRAVLNLIPFNPFPGSKWERPECAEIEFFKNKLVAKRLRVMLRMTKGHDILAACGQLKINKLARTYGKNG